VRAKWLKIEKMCDSRKLRNKRCPGRNRPPISPSGSGERCVKIIVRMEMLGTSSPTTTPVPGRFVGAKPGWEEFLTTSNGTAFPLPYGNGRDPILKERLFGLINSECNHGEDVSWDVPRWFGGSKI
jgi:hypothetical protein